MERSRTASICGCPALDLVGSSLEAIRLFASLLAATGGLAILVALIGMVRAREGDLALLRVMGAGRGQVFGTVMLEGVLTALCGAVLGWVAAHGLIMAARTQYPTLSELGFTTWQPLPAELAVLAGVIGIGALAALIPATSAQAPDYKAGRAVEDVWKSAATPKGGVSWKLLESTEETTHTDAQGYIVSKPKFPPQVKALAGKRITVAGWMMPLTAWRTQKHFVLLGYPPSCPLHFHAAPNQFNEVYADIPFPTGETRVFTVSGVLEMTGYDERGNFYRLQRAGPG